MLLSVTVYLLQELIPEPSTGPVTSRVDMKVIFFTFAKAKVKAKVESHLREGEGEGEALSQH